jgi:Ca2+/Na+ antiporter
MELGIVALGTVLLASLVIWKACDYFEAGSNYVGRGMPPGVRGATINAIGSSLPELLTTFCLLFLFRDQDGFSAGIATCAGSAVFNAVVIPALVILAVVWKRKMVPHIELDRMTVLRDGCFFIGAELLLIWFLNDHVLKWWMGLGLIAAYVVYFSFMMVQIRNAKEDEEEEDEEEDMTTGKAWRYLAGSSAVIGVACYGLSWSVIELAVWWGVPPFMTAVVFGAAATSVPDTVLSLKDAFEGEYDDAVANAIGSNIFDITICLGLPLLCYGLVYGDVTLATSGATAAHVQVLRIGLVGVSAAVFALFLLRPKLKTIDGVFLLGLFGAWLTGLGMI